MSLRGLGMHSNSGSGIDGNSDKDTDGVDVGKDNWGGLGWDMGVQCISTIISPSDLECDQTYNQVVVDWWALAHRLVAKYNNGFIVKGEAGSDMGMAVYPEWWLKAVGFDKWPGKTFVQPKVYHNYVPSFKVVGTGPSVPPGTGTLGPVLLGAAGALIVLAIVRASHQPPARRAEYEYLS